MVVQERDPQSNILRTETRLPQKFSGRLHILSPSHMRAGSTRMTIARKMMSVFLLKFLEFWAQRPLATSAVSCADPVEAYLHACTAVPLFCYVSPAIYGLTSTNDERDITQGSSQQGDEV